MLFIMLYLTQSICLGCILYEIIKCYRCRRSKFLNDILGTIRISNVCSIEVNGICYTIELPSASGITLYQYCSVM